MIKKSIDNQINLDQTKFVRVPLLVIHATISIKGTDRLCKVVLLDSFETYKTFPRCLITEFERKVDV